MILLLPNQRDGLSDLESKIATIPDALEQVFHSVTQKQSKNIVLHLPKFKVESNTDFREPLSQVMAAVANTIFASLKIRLIHKVVW